MTVYSDLQRKAAHARRLYLPPALQLPFPSCLNSLQFYTTLDFVPVKQLCCPISQLWALFFMVSTSSQALTCTQESGKMPRCIRSIYPVRKTRPPTNTEHQ